VLFGGAHGVAPGLPLPSCRITNYLYVPKSPNSRFFIFIFISTLLVSGEPGQGILRRLPVEINQPMHFNACGPALAVRPFTRYYSFSFFLFSLFSAPCKPVVHHGCAQGVNDTAYEYSWSFGDGSMPVQANEVRAR
jgi:hypothetical protein